MESFEVSFSAIAIIDKEVIDLVNGVLCLAFGLPWFFSFKATSIGIRLFPERSRENLLKKVKLALA